ncbi:MAG TPA: hypothetical protein HA276_03820 [Candidatus Poseidoniaceae archaeon]|nr:MAG TPA: hypothetical protein D7I09_01140 [Candidatus Poseidoniales archaeon]DAC17529.1 MAG TPA: hypothetical protein D7I01_03735 [Candidatus Poseidoniales archaeon]HII17940.1 hypothetical protein [Candidatus Poseidoniaceae archaeon]HII96798.1 hypothetical protein [Candidatus Poseidoniaceae archaeon]|tara:strand:- start:111 stop:827 length:717 start_codon:yes stop_codon:yes gene_type:complete
MDDLVRFLVIGLVVAAVLVPVVRWFWARFDRPTEAQLEYEETKRKKREEERMWRQIEAQMRVEEAAAEEAASLARKRAELAAQAAPRSSDVEAALGALGLEEVHVNTTEASASNRPNATEGADAALVDDAVFEESTDDADLEVEGLAKVSLEQDRAGAPAPDWVLIERLREMTEREEEPAPIDVPSMPDLDALNDAMQAIEEDVAPPKAEEGTDLAEATDEAWKAEDDDDDDGWAVEW